MTLLQSDLMAMSNRTARIKAAIKVLEDEGLIEPSPRSSRPHLRLVRPTKPET
jgi:predicted transcriptional regulator